MSESEKSPGSSDQVEPNAQHAQDDVSVAAALAPVEAATAPETAEEVDERPSRQERARHSLRPAPADWDSRPRAQARPATPMVVVYSGDSDRPPPEWTFESARLAEARSAPSHEPFPLASDLPWEGSEAVPALPDAATEEPAPAPESAAPSPPLTEVRPAPNVATSALPDVPVKSVAGVTPRRPHRRSGAVVALLLGGAGAFAWNTRRSAEVPTERSLVAAVEPSRPDVQRSEPQPSASPTPSSIAEPIAAPVSPAPVAPSASASAPQTVEVTLDVTPPDAKVFVRGLMKPGSPPFTFTVEKGRRMSVEITRPGYVARRFDFDGSKTQLAVGLIKRRR